jgi:hypothetical protein
MPASRHHLVVKDSKWDEHEQLKTVLQVTKSEVVWLMTAGLLRIAIMGQNVHLHFLWSGANEHRKLIETGLGRYRTFVPLVGRDVVGSPVLRFKSTPKDI